MALTLTIREGEAVGVGGMAVRVVKIRGGQVRLAFDGPRTIPVLRDKAKCRDPQPTGRDVIDLIIERQAKGLS